MRQIEQDLYPVVDVDSTLVRRIQDDRGAEFALDLLVFFEFRDP
ncbi:MAG TPA: hypothetical protein VIY48_03670 [Candidatus Paceibacterota bacterium]